MMLAGKPHTAAKGSGLIVNFDSTKVRNSTGANKDGKDFYSNDIAAVTAAVLETFKEYNLDPELLMRAILLDSTPVRAVLASHDNDPQLAGKLDPRNLALGVYGDPQQALSDLRHNQ